MHQVYEHAQTEPALAEVMGDPIILALMRFDAVRESDISALREQLDGLIK